MPNVQQTKYKMRDYIQSHGLNLAKMAYDSDVWGLGARTNAWRITSHAGKTPATTKAAVDAVLFPPTLAQRVVRIARAEVGVKESPAGSNDGQRVHEYQAATGAYRQPWCASFVTWCYKRAGYKGALPSIPAYVPSWTAAVHSGAHWREVSFSNARPGDIVTLWNSGHIEIVRGKSGDYLLTIGGNTSPVGQNANGGMVALVSRHRSEVTVIGRPHN
jgi:hypothetical protein